MLHGRQRGIRFLVFLSLLVSACAAKEKPQTPEDYLRLGNKELGQKNETQARKYYQQLLEQYPDSELKAQAQFNIAEALYGEKNYLEARFEYQKFLELYPLSPLASRAQFQLGMCSFQTIQTFDRTQLHTKTALQAFRLFRSKYPQDPLIAQAEAHIQVLRQRLAAHEFAIARFYYRKGAYHAAIGRFLNLIQVYPDVPEIDEAFFMLADSYRAEENYIKARSVFQLFLERFPTSAYLARVRSQLQALPHTGVPLQHDS